LLGYYEGDQLRWAGKVGTGAGWTSTFLRELRKRFDALAVDTSPFVPPVSDPKLRRTSKWVRPELVAEVSFLEWTADGHLRHPSMQGLREDKRARDVVRERAAEPLAKG
jgi:bifunctional non-homologous end joining protein LigD